MPRLTITQLLLGMALVAVFLLFIRTVGYGRPYATIEAVSFSADGSQIAVAKLTGRDAQVPMKRYVSNVVRTVSLVDAANGNSRTLNRDFALGIPGTASCFWLTGRNSVCCDPTNNNNLFYVSNAGVERTNGKTLPLQHPAFNIAVSKSGRYLAVSGACELTVFDCDANSVAMRAETEDMPIFNASHLTFNDEETQLVSGGADGINTWDIATSAKLSTALTSGMQWGNSIAATKNNTLVLCSRDGIHLYDQAGQKSTSLINTNCRLCCISSDRNTLAVATGDDMLIFDIGSNTKTKSISGRGVTSLSFSPDGNRLIAGANDSYLSLFDVATGKQIWRTSPSDPNRWPWGVPTMILVACGLFAVYISWMNSNRKGIRQRETS